MRRLGRTRRGSTGALLAALTFGAWVATAAQAPPSVATQPSFEAASLKLNTSSRRVEDRTGLDGWYELDPAWAGELAGQRQEMTREQPSGGVELFTALREQLGLRLETVRAPLDVLVIEDAVLPSDN